MTSESNLSTPVADPSRGPSSCRSCGQDIQMVPTEASAGARFMPLEPASEDGNIVILNGRAHVFPTASLAADRFPGEPRYLSHFARCPQAGKWRRS